MAEIHTIQEISRAEKILKATLTVLGIPVKGGYVSTEVMKILGISDAEFWRLIARYERGEDGKLRRPDCLESYILRAHRRIMYVELVDFLRRNNGWTRETMQKPQEVQP